MSTLYCLMIDYGPKLRAESLPVDPDLKRDTIVQQLLAGDYDVPGGKGLTQVVAFNPALQVCADITLEIVRDAVRQAEQDGDKLTQQVFELAQNLRLLPIWATAFENGEAIGFAGPMLREMDRQHRLTARELGL